MILLALLAVPFGAAVLSVFAPARSWMEALNVVAFGATFLLALAIVARGAPAAAGHLAVRRLPLCRRRSARWWCC